MSPNRQGARARRPAIAPASILLLTLARCSSTEPGAEAPLDSSSAMAAVLGAEVPQDWVKTPLRCGIAFWAPPDVVEFARQGVDSCVFRFEARSCVFEGDYGSFASRLEEREGTLDYRRQDVVIDDQQAALVEYEQAEGEPSYGAGVHFPGDRAGASSPTATVSARCATREDRDIALVALRTITLIDLETATRPDAGASAPIPIYLEGSSALKVNAGERFTIAVKFIGPSQQAHEPLVDSPHVRFLGIDDTTPRRQSPGGPVRLFRFEALQPGSAIVIFPGAPSPADAGAAGREVTVYVR